MLHRRSIRRLIVLVSVASLVALGGAAPVAHAEEAPPSWAGIAVDLNGRPIPPVRATEYFCHDFDYPEIHCFETAEELEEAVNPELQFMALSGTTFVTVYDNILYQGPYMHISQNHDMLFFVGWNDRISSLRSRNGGRGTFWTDWFSGGRYFDFCCNNWYSSIGSFNDTFSSVYRG